MGGHGAPPPGWGVLASSLGPCLQIRKKFSGECCHQIYLSRCILFCSSPPSPLVGMIIFLNLVLIGEKFLDNVMLVSAIKQCRAAIVVVVVVQSLSHVQLFATPWTAAHQAPLSITSSQSLLKLMSIESAIYNHLILCRPLLLLSSIFPSIRVFCNESVLHIRWPKYLSFSLTSVLPMNIQD